jgi:AraC-like DNA-binding protein
MKTKVLIYFNDKNQRSFKEVGGEGIDYSLADGWDNLSGMLNENGSYDLVIMDSVSPEERTDISTRIKKIKDVPVIYFEENKGRKDPGYKSPSAVSGRGKTSQSLKSSVMEDQDMAPLEKSRRYMDKNFQKQITLAEIADCADISSSYFCRKFKNKYKITPITYLRNLRIAHASYLLEHTNLPLSEITDQSGFFSIPYFCREFRKAKKISPIRYRKTVNTKDH